jgi:exosome complex RNA-binding protein Rrp4
VDDKVFFSSDARGHRTHLSPPLPLRRGHGTYEDDGELVANVSGVVERVNKLVRVRPLQARYVGDVGDVVVGRVKEVS